MKRKTTIVTSLVLALCCLISTLSLAVDATNPDTGVAPCFDYIWGIDMGLDIDMYGKAFCGLCITLYESTHSCRAVMTLQRNDGSGWEDVKSWTGTGGEDLDMEKYWYVLSGYEYRTENTVRVYNANDRLIETYTSYSAVREY